LVDTDLVDPEPHIAGFMLRVKKIVGIIVLRVEEMAQKSPKVLTDCKATSFDDDLPSRERWTPHVRYSLVWKLIFEIANSDLSSQDTILL
jgi:hypothetical protein